MVTRKLALEKLLRLSDDVKSDDNFVISLSMRRRKNIVRKRKVPTRYITRLENSLAKGIAFLLFYVPFYLIVYFSSKVSVDFLLACGLIYVIFVLVVCLIFAAKWLKKYHEL